MPKDGTGYKAATIVYSAIKDRALEKKLKMVGSDKTAVLMDQRTISISLHK